MIKTLIADDNWKNSKNIINNILGKINEVKVERITEDGIETLNAISKNCFDLVLLDLRMPKMNGLEVIEKIKELDIIKIPKIIIISGDLPLIEYASINNIVCNIILKTESTESIYKKILQTVNEIRYENNYETIRKKTILTLKEMGYSLKHRGTIYIIETIMYILENNNLNIISNLERNVYIYIAHKYHTSIVNIKTNIEKSTQAVSKKDFNLSPKDVITEIVNSYVI